MMSLYAGVEFDVRVRDSDCEEVVRGEDGSGVRTSELGGYDEKE